MISHNTLKSNSPLQNHVSSLHIPPPQIPGLTKHSVTPDSSKDTLFRTISKDHRSYHMASKNNTKRVESTLNHTNDSFYRQKDMTYLNQNSNSPTSKNSTEISTKFIRLKSPTSSSSNSKLNVKLFNATDMAKLAMLKLKSKKVYKKLDPNVRQTSAINKKSLSLRISASLPVSDNEEEQNYASLSKIVEGDNSVSTDSKIFSSNKIGSIYQKSPAWKEPQSAGIIRQPKLIGTTKHKTQLPFYLTNTTTISPNHSFSKRITPQNLNLTIGGNAITNKDKIPFSSAGTPVLKKSQKEEILILPKTKSESKSPLRKEEPSMITLKKSGSQKSTKLNLNILKNIFSPNNSNSVQHSKEGDRTPNSHPKSPVDLYRGRNFAFGELSGQRKPPSSNNIKDLQSAVNRLVRTCEQSLEASPDSIEKVKKAQEGVLIKLKKFCQNEDPPECNNNVESIFIKDKKLSEGNLYLLRSDNEKLKESIRTKKQNVDIYLKKDNHVDLNLSSETMSLDDNLETGKEKTNEELKKIVIHQQRVIASLKQREKAMKKALTLIQADGLEILEFKHPGVLEKKDTLKTDEKTRTYPEIQSLIVDDLTAEEQNQLIEEDIEETGKVIVDGEKQVSLVRDSRGESGRLVPIKGTTSSAKSTMDSAAAHSTRKQMNNNRAGNRSLSSQMKNQLMLDFTILGSNQPLPISNKDSNNYNSADKQNINNGGGPDSGQPFGFHEEFMSRLDEFSFSWRQAAMNQRKI